MGILILYFRFIIGYWTLCAGRLDLLPNIELEPCYHKEKHILPKRDHVRSGACLKVTEHDEIIRKFWLSCKGLERSVL